MAVPKKRVSLSRRRKRQANMRFELPSLVVCACGGFRRAHCLCERCGRYRGKQVLRFI